MGIFHEACIEYLILNSEWQPTVFVVENSVTVHSTTPKKGEARLMQAVRHA
jgi:hypothetical protein